MPGINRYAEDLRVVKRLATLAEEVTKFNAQIKEAMDEIMDFSQFYNRVRGRRYKLRLALFDDDRRYRRQIE